MKIGILSRNSKLYSTRRLVEAAREHGHEAIVIDTMRCYMNIAATNPAIHIRGEKLVGLDAVIPRIGASVTFYGAALVRQFEMMGIFTANKSIAIVRSRDKLRCMQLLARRNIGLPVTGFAHSPDDIPNLISMVGGPPLVVKVLEGTHGKGVVLCETYKAAENVMEAFLGIDANIMVQEYIAEANGADIRCLVVGDRVVAAMRRQASPGEFRSNLHRGGRGERARITPYERRAAVAATKILGLKIAGVDMIRSNHGPLVLEVNSTPGLQGIEDASGVDVAGRIVKFIEQQVKLNRTYSRDSDG